MIRTFTISALILIFITAICCGDSFALNKKSHITKRPAKKKPAIKVSWQERDNRIIHDSVCLNYPEGDITYRDCRQEARVIFRQRCEKYTDLYQKTKAPYHLKHEDNRDKYCYAASQYWP